MPIRRPVAIVFAAALLAACSGSDDPGAVAGATTPDASTVPSTEPTATVPATALDTTPDTTPDTTAAPEPTAAPTTIAPPADWVPIDVGPYEVGVATLVLDDPDRPLTVDVWFPLDTTTDVAALSPQRYTLLPDIYYESPAAFAATVEQVSGDAPFPLVVYSHGSGGLRYIHSSYTEVLASHGYLVVAPDHTGNTAIDLLAGSGAAIDEIALNRPTDVKRVIDAFVDAAHPVAGPFAAKVDAERIVVTGHSFGGFTAIATVTGFSNALGDTEPDPRVDAIVPLAPAVGAQLLPDELLARIDVPIMVVVGTDDTTTPVDPNVTRLWDATTSTPAYRIELVAAEHQTFTDICAYQDDVPTLPNVPEIVSDTIDAYAEEGCSEGDMDAGRATELTNTYVLQFLDQVLRGGPAIDPTVVGSPADVIFMSR